MPVFVRKILKKFESEGYEIYIVGGVIRDLIINKGKLPPGWRVDWDFTTNATPPEILALFPDGFYDNQFGTVGIVFGKPPAYEITTFRKEMGYTDCRHPDKVVWGKTIEDDLIRRDFTINAMALQASPSGQALKKKTWNFKLTDHHEGQKDLKSKLIRAVGNPNERFKEDALRMMRAVRIAAQLGFTIEEKTFQAIKNNLNLIDQISAERIKDELLKLLSYSHAADGYLLLRNSGLAGKILPEVERSFGVAQKSPGRHHLWDVGTHSVNSLRFCRAHDPIVKLATLIHDVGKPVVVKKQEDGVITFYNHELVGSSIAANIAKRLRFSRKDSQRLVTLVRWHQFTVDERQTDNAVRRFIRNVGRENIEDMLCLRTADRLGGGAKETSWRLEKFKKKIAKVQEQPFSVSDLKVGGNEVMKALNIPPGPLVGKILDRLFEEVEEDKEKNNKPYLLGRIKQIPAKDWSAPGRKKP